MFTMLVVMAPNITLLTGPGLTLLAGRLRTT
jgi:hypothetical protein